MRRLAIAMTLSTSVGLAQAAGPHVHGQGNLDLAMAGGTLLVELSLPAADVVGFEHAPRDDDQKALVKDALARLGKGTNVLEPAPAAACKVTRESVHSGLSDSETEEHDHGEESPDHDADHDHDHDHGGHADFEARYRWHCDHPEKLEWIDVPLLEFLNGVTLKVQLVTDQGARADSLKAPRTRLSMDLR